MNWLRRLIGFDPAGRSGGVTVFKLGNDGELRLDGELWQHSPAKLDALVREFVNYQPRGNPLEAKGNGKLHGLHLEDYQPRGSDHPALRVVREKSFPEPPPLTFEDIVPTGRWGQERARDWVHYRNRHPGVRDFALGTHPPMRNALRDLLGFLVEFDQDLHERGLVAVEVDVQHEPAEQVGGAPQGWHFRVEALTVPVAALEVEDGWHENYRIAAAKAAAEAKDRFEKA